MFRKTAVQNSARRYRPAIIDRRRPIVFRDGALRAFNRSEQIFVVTFQFLPAKEENWFYVCGAVRADSARQAA